MGFQETVILLYCLINLFNENKILMKVEHKLVENKNNGASEFILSVNGLQAPCPFKQPIPVNDTLRGSYIFSPPCSSLCPLFEFEEKGRTVLCVDGNKNEKITQVVLHCGDGERKIAIQEVIHYQEPKAPLITS